MMQYYLMDYSKHFINKELTSLGYIEAGNVKRQLYDALLHLDSLISDYKDISRMNFQSKSFDKYIKQLENIRKITQNEYDRLDKITF